MFNHVWTSRVFTAISCICTLQRLRVEFDFDFVARVTPELLALLLPLRDMQKLELAEVDEVAVTDNDLMTVAQAWPDLKYLRLADGATYGGSAIEDREGPIVTYTGLLALYDACPHLYFARIGAIGGYKQDCV